MKALRSILTIIFVSSFIQVVWAQEDPNESNSGSISKKFDFRVYPNPASLSTTISVNNGNHEYSVDIFILEMNGKIIKEYNYDNVKGREEFTLSLDFLINGIYNIAVQTNETYQVERLIVLK